MRRFTNLALAFLLLTALATGLVTQGIGTSPGRIASFLHGAAGLGLLVLVPWKSMVVRGGVQRRGIILASWSLLATTLITVASGLAQAGGLLTMVGPLGIMQVHIGAAVLTTILLGAHYLRHPVRPRRVDLARRNLLRLASVGLGASAAVVALDGAAHAAGWRRSERRFTGSHERGSGDPAAMPVTQWFLDQVPAGAHDTITVGGKDWTVDALRSLRSDAIDATLDCTSGWYSTQSWRGIRLDRLLGDVTARSIEITSVTGYGRRFPARDVGQLWLVFEVGGAPLSRGHGAPARLVAPGRRGFWWVKWVRSIETSDVPAWLQVPFPLR